MTQAPDIQALSGESMNLTEHNIEQLKQLFPNVFTEGKIDFEALKSELGEFTETDNERYQFTWNGKEQAKRIATTPTLGTLRPSPAESVNWDTTENIYIEGDNLEALKLLQKSYFGKIKMIYIDPPYNTGKDFVYKDDFKDNLANYQRLTGQKDEEGNPLTTNTDSSGRYHSNWLNMMYPRLKLARNLLKDDGVIFISIDDNELHNLRKVCDEIFGEANFRNIFTTRRYDKNINRQFISDGLKSFNTGFEYILCYAKSSKFTFKAVYREAPKARKEKGYWKGFWNDADRPTMRYDLLGAKPDTGQWKWSSEKSINAVENYKKFLTDFSDQMTLEEYWEATGKKLKFIRRNIEGKGKNQGVEHWIPPSSEILRNNNWQDLFASVTTNEVKNLFDFPKNPQLIKLMIETSTGDEPEIIMDFFSGSASTAQAVMEFNHKNNTNHKFILIQIPEKANESKGNHSFSNICEIAKERMKRSIENIGNKLNGYKTFKLDTSNFKRWQPTSGSLEKDLIDSINNIMKDRSQLDLVYEIMIKYGLPLTLNIEKLTARVNSEEYEYHNIQNNSLLIFNQTGLSIPLIKKILQDNDNTFPILRIVLFDECFTNDIDKLNAVKYLEQNNIEDIVSI